MNKFMFAIIQHPMVLAVHEDRGEPIIGERTSPWGAADIFEYADRVRRNLNALSKHPALKLNYEFSGLELEIIAANAPDIIPVMREMVSQGRLSFVGGDYSQPHGHLYSGELNFRQLIIGLRVLSDLVGYRASCFFHQETWLHDQMPQILKAFSYRSASVPLFPYTVTVLPGSQGPSIVASDCNPGSPIHSDSIALWRGLDGTEIPTLVTGVIRAGLDRTLVIQEEHKDMYRSSDFVIMAPDMDEISDEDVHFIQQYGEAVQFDSALYEAIQHQQTTWNARLHTYWSYAEGEWAEVVNRKIRQTEALLLAEEAIVAINGDKTRNDAGSDWKTLLAAMHHDVHWMEITDLKKTYMERLQEVDKKAYHQISKSVNALTEISTDMQWIRIVNPLPFARSEVVHLYRPILSAYDVIGDDGRKIPSLCIPSADHSGADIYFVTSIPSLDFLDFNIVETSAPLVMGEECEIAEFACGQNTIHIASDGTVSKIMVNDRNILSGSGNDLHFLDCENEMVGGPGRGGNMVSFHGENVDIVRIISPVGDIGTEMEFILSPILTYFSITTQFKFENHTIGVCWRDRTKLNCYWPVKGNTIRHDIAYGAVDGREHLPLHAPGWVSVREEQQGDGLAVINTGNPKHFVDNGTIGCILAWGGSQCSRIGMDFSSRRDVNTYDHFGEYDLRLNGIHRIKQGIQPLTADISEAEIARTAQCVNSPLIVCGLQKNRTSAEHHRALDFSGTGLVCCAVFRRDGQIMYRVHEGESRTHSTSEICSSLGEEIQFSDLTGNDLNVIAPYKIGYITVKSR